MEVQISIAHYFHSRLVCSDNWGRVRISTNMTIALWFGRATKEEVFEVQDKLFHWALHRGASKATALKVVNCLQ